MSMSLGSTAASLFPAHAAIADAVKQISAQEGNATPEKAVADKSQHCNLPPFRGKEETLKTLGCYTPDFAPMKAGAFLPEARSLPETMKRNVESGVNLVPQQALEKEAMMKALDSAMNLVPQARPENLMMKLDTPMPELSASLKNAAMDLTPQFTPFSQGLMMALPDQSIAAKLNEKAMDLTPQFMPRNQGLGSALPDQSIAEKIGNQVMDLTPQVMPDSQGLARAPQMVETARSLPMQPGNLALE